MSGVYEFHVTGLLGPVARAALPGLSSRRCATGTVVTGHADRPDEIEDLLHRLAASGLTATHIRIVREPDEPGPGVDPPPGGGGAQRTGDEPAG